MLNKRLMGNRAQLTDHFETRGLTQASGVLYAALLLIGSLAAPAHAQPAQRTQRLFQRLAGVPLPLADPRGVQMEALVGQGRLAEAAHIATQDDNFLNVTVKHAFTPISNRNETPLFELNDLVATAIGVVRDDRNAKELLTGNYFYRGDPALPGIPNVFYEQDFQGDNDHYRALESANVNLAQSLVRVPMPSYLTDYAGLLTTRAWFEAHMFAGTYRRPIEFAFREFMCTPISVWRDQTNPHDRIRQDVSRAPGGSAMLFQTQCATCHSGMDAMSTAYRKFNYVERPANRTRIFYLDENERYNINSTIYPDGYRSPDDSWINYAVRNRNVAFGWRSGPSEQPVSGYGIHQFGQMIADSYGFSTCMTQRVFKEVCRRDPVEAELAQGGAVDRLAHDFEGNGYKLRRLFELAAIEPGCLGSQP